MNRVLAPRVVKPEYKVFPVAIRRTLMRTTRHMQWSEAVGQ